MLLAKLSNHAYAAMKQKSCRPEAPLHLKNIWAIRTPDGEQIA